MSEDCQVEALGFGTRKSEGRQHGAELAAAASCSISWWAGDNSLKRWIVEDFLPLPHKKTNFCSEKCTKGSRWTFFVLVLLTLEQLNSGRSRETVKAQTAL